MISKNNTALFAQAEQRQHFGLRKLSIGVASVLLGTSWAMINSVAHADTIADSQDAGTTADANTVNTSANTYSVANQQNAVAQGQNAQNTTESSNPFKEQFMQNHQAFVWNSTHDTVNVVTKNAGNQPVTTGNTQPVSGNMQGTTVGVNTSAVPQETNSIQRSNTVLSVQSTNTQNKAVMPDVGNSQPTSFNDAKYDPLAGLGGFSGFGGLGGVGTGSSSFNHHPIPPSGTSTGSSTGSSTGGDVDVQPTAPPVVYGSCDVYVVDDDTHQIVGHDTGFGECPGGKFFNIASLVPRPANTWTTSDSLTQYVSYAPGAGNDKYVHISHVKRTEQRAINVKWNIKLADDLKGRAVAGGKSATGSTLSTYTETLHQNGIHDLYDKTYTWKGVVGHPKAPSNVFTYSQWMTPMIIGSTSTVNGSSGAPGYMSIAGGKGAAGFNNAKLIMNNPSTFSWMPGSLQKTTESNGAKSSVSYVTTTTVGFEYNEVPITIHYFWNEKIKKNGHTTTKKVTWPDDMRYGKIGDTVDLKLKPPLGFKFKNKKWKDKKSVLTFSGDLAGKKAPVYKIELELDPQVNWRYVDLQDTANQVATRPVKKSNKAGKPHDYEWTDIDKGQIKASDKIENLHFIDSYGLDGKSNEDKRKEQVAELIRKGYDFRYFNDVKQDDTKGGNDFRSKGQGNGGTLQDMQRFGSDMTVTTFIIDGKFYAVSYYQDGLGEAVDKHTNKALTKSKDQYKNSRANQLAKEIKQLEQKQAALHSQISSASTVSAIRSLNSQMVSISNKLDADIRALKSYDFGDLMKKNLKPVKAINGAMHLYDTFTSEYVPVDGVTLLASGQPVTSGFVKSGEYNIFDPNTYGKIRRFGLKVVVKENANKMHWPPEQSNGPVMGFVGQYGVLDSKDHFNDPEHYDPIYNNQLPEYDYDKGVDAFGRAYDNRVAFGAGQNLLVDDVTGNVTAQKYSVQMTNNPVFYFPQFKGYDLYINGNYQNDKHPSITPDMYNALDLNRPNKNDNSAIKYVVEYRPQVSHIALKIVDQFDNVIDNQVKDVNVDASLSIGGDDYGTKYINDYNKAHDGKSVMTYDSTDMPLTRTIQPDEAKQTITYTYHVNIANIGYEAAGTDQNVRVIKFVNVDDPSNSIAAMTDSVTLQVQKEILDDKQGNKSDTANYKYQAEGSFQDMSGSVNSALSGKPYTIASGGQYLGAFTPDQPGGETVMIEYHGGVKPEEPTGDGTEDNDNYTDNPDLSDNNEDVDNDDDVVIGEDY